MENLSFCAVLVGGYLSIHIFLFISNPKLPGGCLEFWIAGRLDPGKAASTQKYIKGIFFVVNSLFTLDMPFLKFVHISSEGNKRSSMTRMLDQFRFRHEKIQTSLFWSVFYTLKFESGKT